MWAFAWLFVLEAVVIVAANAATIVILARTRRLHRKQYILIINQAIADLFVGLVSVPMYTYWTLLNRPKGLFFVIFIIQDPFFGVASLSGLTALAIERAHATYFPFKHSTLGKGPYIIGIVLMWTAPFIVAVAKSREVLFSVVALMLVIIISAYSLIVLQVRYGATPQVQDVNIQENKKLTVTVAVVTILSLVMWLPLQCLTAVGFKASPFIYNLVKILQYGNSLVNSVVYAFRMREIKRQISRIFQCYRSNQISVNIDTEVGNL